MSEIELGKRFIAATGKISALANAGKAVDDLEVVDALTANGQLESVGGMAYVSDLSNQVTGGMGGPTALSTPE
jgi:hypothetical protein